MRGAYPADRAAALSGVPKSTIHDWDRKGVLNPSVSRRKIKLWSYSDLMALRAIQWMRSGKTTDQGSDVPPSSMPAVRGVLAELVSLDLEIWSADRGPRVLVDRAGRLHVRDDLGRTTAVGGQRVMADLLDLLAPFDLDGRRGPDLQRPRPRLRIVPGKLSGAPHVKATRIESQAIAALGARGMSVDLIGQLYPELEPGDIEQALDLERELLAV